MVVNGIDTKDISVVVQGAVDAVNTPKCLASIRKYLPGAEIILSTWEGTKVEGLDFDKVLLNKDPGGSKDGRTGIQNNINRQLLSTKCGIEKVKRIYCIKLRGDLILRSNKFLGYFSNFPEYDKNYRIFKGRVIQCSYFCKRYLGEARYYVLPTPFHISDWFACGYTEDVYKLFNIPLTSEPFYTNYLNYNEVSSARKNIFGASHQYAPEQYILLNCLLNSGIRVPEFNSIEEYDSENIEFSNKILANNFITLNPSQISLYCGKNGIDPYRTWSKSELKLPMYIWEGLYRYDIFLQEYKKYCAPNFDIPVEAVIRKKFYLLLHKFFEVRG